MVAPLRILFIALAILFGTGLTAAGAIGVWELLQFETANGSDGPPPFSLSSYGYTPVIAAIVLLSGLAALKQRWEALALACWFLLGGAVLEALYVIWILGRHGAIPESVADAFAVVWAFFPLLGLVLAAKARSREETLSEAPPSVATQERLRLRNTLIGMAAVSYLWRAIAMWLSPGLTFAIAYLRGMSDLYGPEQVVLSGVVGLGAAIVLLACVVVSSKTSDKIMHATLAFTAGFAFEGFLDTLDYAFRLGSLRELTYALQDAVAFVACCLALALSVQGKRMSPRLTAA
jgi:hypothetical protein